MRLEVYNDSGLLIGVSDRAFPSFGDRHLVNATTKDDIVPQFIYTPPSWTVHAENTNWFTDTRILFADGSTVQLNLTEGSVGLQGLGTLQEISLNSPTNSDCVFQGRGGLTKYERRAFEVDTSNVQSRSVRAIQDTTEEFLKQADRQMQVALENAIFLPTINGRDLKSVIEQRGITLEDSLAIHEKILRNLEEDKPTGFRIIPDDE